MYGDKVQFNSGGTVGIEQVIKVKPDAVRVWRGFRATQFQTDRTGFIAKLGSVFMPLTIQIMSQMGLTAYLPTVVPQDINLSVPDEIALVFYQSQETYQIASTQTTGGRAYGMLHRTIFNFSTTGALLPSKSAFPVKFNGQIVADIPYFILDEETDWYYGITNIFIGVRQRTQTVQDFLELISNSMTYLQNNCPYGLDGCIFVISGDCLIYWMHWMSQECVLEDLFDDLKQQLRIVFNNTAKSVAVLQSLSDVYEGLNLQAGDSLNLQYNRRNRF